MSEIAQSRLASVERCFRAGFTAHDAATKLEIDLDGVRKVYDELRGEPSNECKVLMKAGSWLVPPEERPKGWERMGLSEPMTVPERPPYALRELPSVNENRKLTVDLRLTSEPESLDETGENIDATLQAQPVKQPTAATIKWASVRPLVSPLQIGEEVIVGVPSGIDAARFRGNLSSILNAWKETQNFKWSVNKISEEEIRVTKTGKHRSLVSDLVRDRAGMETPHAPPIVSPHIVSGLKDAASECRDLIKVLDAKMEKIKQLRDLLEDPYIASIFMSVIRDSKGSGDSL